MPKLKKTVNEADAPDNRIRQEIMTMSDESANMFNIKCLTLFALFAVLSVVLNELGLFKVDRSFMIPAMSLSFVIFILPLAVYLISRKSRGTDSHILTVEWLHKFIIACGFIGTSFVCVALSFHAVILMVLPILIASQYRKRNYEFEIVLIASIVMVPVCVYGSFFFGTPDRNFIKGVLSDEEAALLINRIAIVIDNPKRMLEIFLHYALPRMLGVTAVALLSFGISRRNSVMSDKQIELSRRIQEEMTTRHEMQNHVIELLANVIETRDVSTGLHIIHTKQYVELIARAMQNDDKYNGILTDEVIERLISAAPLHDIGKIVVSDSILLKPGKLTKEEFENIKLHTSAGEKLISDFFSEIDDTEFLKTAEEIAACHHEKWDGSGYPCGLKGEEIPLSARIMAIADVFDALVSVRVYKDSISPEAALEIIYSESGSHFDPDIVRIVRMVSNRMIEIANSNKT